MGTRPRIIRKGKPVWTRYIGSTSFDPISLGNLEAWWKADAGITLNGSNVSQWDDQSGNGKNLTQATAGSQPLYVASGINGFPSLTFDGVDFLSCTPIITLANQTIFIVYKKAGGGNYVILDYDGTVYPLLHYGGTLYNGNSTLAVATTNNTWYARAWKSASGLTQPEFFSNGVSLGLGSANDSATRNYLRYVGSLNGAAGLDGSIAEILVYNDVKSDADILLVNNYINTKYAIY